LTEKIAYLKDLGVTAVELMPVAEFNESELVRLNPITAEKLKNYWGYNPVAFFAPKQSYSVAGGPGQQVIEFREMVKELHRAGIEVILDIVLNHTAEGDELGPTICSRGIDNSIFYMLEDNGLRYYKDFTGVGNTINANHPVVREIVVLVLRYWVMHMHIDGFRFDLASVLGRDQHWEYPPQCAPPRSHCRRSYPARHKDYCRSLGCWRCLSSRVFFHASLDGMEWSVS